MAKRIGFFLFLIVMGVGSRSDSSGMRHQNRAPDQVSNKCVNCHSGLPGPSEVSTWYLEWHRSPHKANGVGCEKCHGGDSSTEDLGKAHTGMLPSQDASSRLHNRNLPETCGKCHREIINSFVESAHYQRLKESGMGPSCTTCHRHMATAVARYPSEGATFCSFCHNTINGLQPRKPEIPENARATLESIGRANSMVMWINDLLSEAQKKKIAVDEEKEALRMLKITLREAKTGWHALNLSGPRTKGDKAFEEGVKVKDRLAKKLGHD